MALSSVANLKIHLGITDSAQDSLLTQLLSGADQAIKSYLKRDIESASYTWYLDGNGERDLLLPQYPVTAITSVHLHGGGYYGAGTDAFASTYLLTSGTDYVLVQDHVGGTARGESGRLRKLGTVSGGSGGDFGWYPSYGSDSGRRGLAGRKVAAWPRGSGNIKVIATAGYSTVPQDIIQAVHQLTAWMMSIKDKGMPVTSESLGSYSYSVAAGGLSGAPELGTTRQLLMPYRRIIF